MQAELRQTAFQTFRDPAGSTSNSRPDGAYRSIRSPEAEEILAFLATPLAAQLVEQGCLSASTVLPPETDPETNPSTTTPIPASC